MGRDEAHWDQWLGGETMMDARGHSPEHGHGGSKEQREENRGWANLS